MKTACCAPTRACQKHCRDSRRNKPARRQTQVVTATRGAANPIQRPHDVASWLAAFGLISMGVASWTLLLVFVTTPLQRLAGLEFGDLMRVFVR